MATESQVLRTYHCHVYCSSELWSARDHGLLHEAMFHHDKFHHLAIGAIHDKPIGPHPRPMFEIDFNETDFMELVNYLMLNRGNSSVLIHPITDNSFKDHTQYCIWLGDKLNLDLSKL